MPTYKVRTSIPSIIYYEYSIEATCYNRAKEAVLSGEVAGEMVEFYSMENAQETIVEITETRYEPKQADTSNFVNFLKSQI